MSKSYIKCLECNTVNLNNDYCSNCGAIIDIVLKRNLERENINQKKIVEKAKNEPNRIGEFLKKGEKHSNILVRILFKVSYSIWLFFAVVMGGIIATVIAIAAG